MYNLPPSIEFQDLEGSGDNKKLRHPQNKFTASLKFVPKFAPSKSRISAYQIPQVYLRAQILPFFPQQQPRSRIFGVLCNSTGINSHVTPHFSTQTNINNKPVSKWEEVKERMISVRVQLPKSTRRIQRRYLLHPTSPKFNNPHSLLLNFQQHTSKYHTNTPRIAVPVPTTRNSIPHGATRVHVRISIHSRHPSRTEADEESKYEEQERTNARL